MGTVEMNNNNNTPSSPIQKVRGFLKNSKKALLHRVSSSGSKTNNNDNDVDDDASEGVVVVVEDQRDDTSPENAENSENDPAKSNNGIHIDYTKSRIRRRSAMPSFINETAAIAAA